MQKILYILLMPLFLMAKTPFSQEMIQLYLNEKNPYFYATVAEQYVSQEHQNIYKAAFDTQFNLKYDNKRYPTTQGEYQQADITKAIGNGMEFSILYRNAQDIQEYNNIKTGKDGEIQTNIKIPILSLINNTSQNQLDYNLAKLKTKELTEQSKKNLLSLYYIVSKVYFELLLYKNLYQTEEELLHKAEVNYAFINKEVLSGKRAKIALLDVQSQVINRKQRLLSAKNSYKNLKNSFLNYLNILESSFDQYYTLPDIKIVSLLDESIYKEAESITLHNRPEFQTIEYQIEKRTLQSQYNSIKKYPKFDIKLHAAYDLAYEKDGYKASMELNFPLERSDYTARDQTYKKETLLLENTKETIKNNILTTIKNIIQKLSLQKKNIALAQKEIKLVKALEKAESTKYKEGISSLVFVNQREILTLKAEQKLLHYFYQQQLLQLQLKYELGILLKKS